MSDIFPVETPFDDVASLAQGYMNRADGERLLLPLPVGCELGAGVRFVVLLADGTPAFAGAGLCVQATDQGSAVPPAQRFETLLDSLAFDERSQPVYDYIVAVRSATYTSASETDAVDLDAVQSSSAPHEETDDAFELEGIGEEAAAEFPAQSMPSFVPAPIPTGLLMRPARAARWQPLPPRRPTPRPQSGLFRYLQGGLPMPARPPRPDIDPSEQVQPAPRPA